jgi:hypothetical protein
MLSRHNILDWVEANELKGALDGIPDSDSVLQREVDARKDLILTAIGVNLLEHHERASDEMQLSLNALKLLGIHEDESEHSTMPVFVTNEEFNQLASRTPFAGNSERTWRTLYRGRDNNEGLFDEYGRLSITKAQSILPGISCMLRIGEVSMSTLQAVISAKIPSEA